MKIISMGFYIRKSVNVGPFRFNFSNSGIGVSAGIKGLRVGTSPRGNYVSVGRGGLRYRATLPSTPRSSPIAHTSSPTPPPVPQKNIPGVGPMVAIESAPSSAMQDSTSLSLLDELNGKAVRPNYWKWTAGVGVVGLGLVAQNAPSYIVILLGAMLLALTGYVWMRDIVAKTVVLCYELDTPNERSFETLHAAFGNLRSCQKAWRIDARGAVHDSKYHGGAGTLIKRKDAYFGMGLPPKVKCNLDVPFLKAGTASFYFMPDRLLVYSTSGVGAIPYVDLRFDGSSKRFIEDGGVPSDAKVVGSTWRFVNKNGGPDKRFKDNKQLPIALYEELRFHSASGLNEVIQVSRHSVSESIEKALVMMKNALPS